MKRTEGDRGPAGCVRWERAAEAHFVSLSLHPPVPRSLGSVVPLVPVPFSRYTPDPSGPLRGD